MQDDKDPEIEEQPTGEERRSKPLQPFTKPENPPPEPETISLLDLMAEEEGDPGQKTIILSSEAKTTALPPLVPSDMTGRRQETPPLKIEAADLEPDDDQATPTATIHPPGVQSEPPTPTTSRTERPLTRPEFRPPESTPTVEDTEATTVQPRVAFPGATQMRPPNAG